MNLWIAFSLIAAAAQNVRFMLQKQLKAAGLSTAGATFSRFAWSAPAVAAFVAVRSGADPPPVPPEFWIHAAVGGAAQILGTGLVVALFAWRNFTVGVTLMKTEVMMTALVGFAALGDRVAPAALAAIAVGAAGVVLLSDPPPPGAPRRPRVFTRASAYGVGAGFLFSVSAVGYRGASLSVPTDDFILRATMTLAAVTLMQSAAMAVWMRIMEPGEISRVFRRWRKTAPVGFFSMIGSAGWFIAFTLQNAAYVKAVGQVELLFAALTSRYVFGERASRRELLGVGLIAGSVAALVLAARPGTG